MQVAHLQKNPPRAGELPSVFTTRTSYALTARVDNSWSKYTKGPRDLNNPKKVTCRFCPCLCLKRSEFSQTHEVAGASAESDPWCLETPRLSEFCHCMPCHGHSRCTFHAACTPRSCTAHARDFDARAMRLSWSSGHDTPHVWPASYPMIRNLRTLK